MEDPKPTLLLVDDEERILRSLAMLFRSSYNVLTTVDANQALEIVARERVHVIVSDQKMPVMRGADLLRLVKERSPNTMRILLTGYSELESVVACAIVAKQPAAAMSSGTRFLTGCFI